jgi:outer membrane lipoprotein-sorting protein
MRAKHHILAVVFVCLLAATSLSGQKAPSTKDPVPANSRTTAGLDPSLDAVLSQMDKASEGFHTAEADFVWDQYQKVINETDTQKGKVYFRRSSKEIQMALRITSPEVKYVLFNDDKISLYQPKIGQVTEREVGKNRGEIESFLVLGFGGRGHDLLTQYDVKFAGNETVDGIKTAKLELTPKSEKVRNMFEKFILWVDPVRDISLKQQAFEPGGDNRIAKYSNITLNKGISDDVFKLRTTKHTRVVHQQ